MEGASENLASVLADHRPIFPPGCQPCSKMPAPGQFHLADLAFESEECSHFRFQIGILDLAWSLKPQNWNLLCSDFGEQHAIFRTPLDEFSIWNLLDSLLFFFQVLPLGPRWTIWFSDPKWSQVSNETKASLSLSDHLPNWVAEFKSLTVRAYQFIT